MDIIGTVRRRVGRRHKISRQEMADILTSLAAEGLDLGNDCMSHVYEWIPATDRHGMSAGGIRPDAPRIWANACTHITCISVLADGCIPHGQVRYDQPGSMAPMQHAVLMFVPAELGDHEYDQIGQMRRKADRLLIVSGEELREPPEPVKVPEWITRLRRRHPRVDGSWARIHDDGTLELRDPNDGQSSDPADKCRHQYRVARDGNIVKRRLPPESVGDQWAYMGPDDLRPHEWELSQTPPVDDLLYAWWEEQVL